jgi:hypothetical protein
MLEEEEGGFTFAKYALAGGYLTDGSGGKVSCAHFAQLKECQPFVAARFVALVNSMEGIANDLGVSLTILPLLGDVLC